MEINRKLLSSNRKTKVFRANFERMLAIVQANKVLLITTGEFRVIDILGGHTRKIKCLDVSQISKIVVSFSKDLIVVHSPMKDEQIMSDHVINAGVLKWKESWRYTLKLPVRNLNISTIGDFFVITGDDLMSVWNKDSPYLMSYSNLIHYSSTEDKSVLANIVKQTPVGNIIQSEVTKDGRMIICLEQRGKTLMIYNQEKIPQVKQEKNQQQESSNKGLDWRSLNKNDYRGYKKEEKPEVPLGANPYADMENLDNFDYEYGQKKEQTLTIQELNEYQLPNHRFSIEYFKILQHDFYESEKRYLPNVILTVTSKNEIFMWQENLMSQTLVFQCVHIFKGYQQTPFFDVCFLEFPPINPKRYVEIKNSVSRLLDPGRDETLKLKKEDNQYGIYRENYHETTLDWVLVLNDMILEIYRVEGLRNFPHKSLNISQFNRIQMTYNPRDFFGTCKLFSASCRDFNDILSLYCINNLGQIIKLRKDFKEQAKWKIDKVALLQRKTIESVIVHQQLPFVAHLMKNTEIYFFIDEQSKNQIIKRPDMKFMGAYSVFHTSKHQNVLKNHITIKSAKWVKDLCMMVLHFSNNSIALLSSHTQLRILVHSQYPDEYLKLWQEKRSQIAEKWEKLYEIKFDEGENHEQIVDFEILNTKITQEGFTIQIAIFTDKNHYMVYENVTTFGVGMKAHSKSDLIFEKYTTDNMMKLLGSYNSFDNENRTVMAMVTEIDPDKQPPELKQQQQQKPAQSKNPFYDEDDGSDSEEEDIFSQMTGGSKKKDKYQPLKKKAQEEVKMEEPLKHQLLLKLVQFNEKSLKNKEYQELWKIELPLAYKNKEYKCKCNQEFFGFMMYDGPNNDIYIYIYDLTSSKYIGFLNLTEILGAKHDINQIDFVMTKGSNKGSITLYCQDNLYLIAQSAREGMSGKWSIIKKYENVVSIDKTTIRNVQLYESPWRRLIIVLNKDHLDIKDKFVLIDEDAENSTNAVVRTAALHQIFTNSQKSFALYDPRLLKALFCKGYVTLVLKVLVKLQHMLKNSPQSITDFLDLDLNQIIQEIQEIQTANSSQAATKKKQENAASLFDDFYGFGEEEKKTNEVKQETVNPTQQLEKEFEDGFKEFITNIRAHGKIGMGLSENQKREYIEFVKKFKQLYRKDLQADNLTAILLRKVYFDTEDVEMEMQDQKKEEKPSGQPFNVMEFIQSIRSQPNVSKANINLITQWTSLETALALHSDSQDMIINELQNRFDFDNNLSWDIMKKLCIPVWLKDSNKLKQLVEKVAKVEYRLAGDDFNKSSKAEKTALWYILINKKNFLITLYKQEPQQKKVYEFLLQDFEQQKIKTQASKNALALMSKKNYYLSCAFFLLAGALKDTAQVALDRLQDPVLAILIVRLMDEEGSEHLKELYLKYFVQRGEKLGDPYLQNIGRWQRKEFLKSVNLFQPDSTKQNNIDHILKHDQNDFNLYFSKSKEESKVAHEGLIPSSWYYDYYVLDFVKALKKNTNVKRDMQKTWTNTQMSSGGGGDSIFDDFFGGGSSAKKEEKKDDAQEEKKLIIDESKILEITSFETSQRGYSLVSMIVMFENGEHLDKMENKYKQLVANSLITDFIQGLMSGDSYGLVQKLGQVIKGLADKLEINYNEVKDFVGKQLRHIDNLNLVINYLIDEGKEGVMYKVEQEALKQMNFIHSLADFPFITESQYTDKRGFNIIKMVNFLENLVESYMQVDFQEHQKESVKPQANAAPLTRGMSLMYGDDEENFKEAVDEKIGNIQIQNLDVTNKMISQKEVNLKVGFEEQFQNISTKIRTTLIIYVALIQLCYISRKFGLVKSLLVDLKNILGNRTVDNAKEDDDINLQNLKTKIQKFKYQLQKPEEEQVEEIEYQRVGYNKPTKEEEDLVKRKNKINQFMVLWLRYIICHHVFMQIKFYYEKSQIRDLIDVRPSVIQTRPFNEAIEIIMNPRLVSGELLKKFANMHRILENVGTYYFENFLNLQERSIITDELKRISQAKFDHAESDHISMTQLFGNDNKFQEFAHYLDINGFIKHLKDHELSLVYHTNNDYSQQTVKKVQDLLEGGIDIFRLKGETVNGFAFDRCEQDLVSLALLNKGIREIPVKKALLYRNRMNRGHQVLDEECNNWHDCLKRYDKVEQEHQNIKPTNEPIIAIVDKLYSYKTVNYTKKPRVKFIALTFLIQRTRGTLFLDYEMNPPDIWSGVKSLDYLKVKYEFCQQIKARSNLDITHEDYTYAVESHPYLPLYMSGNARGLLCLWGFNQSDDKSLDQWVTDNSEARNINPKKATIKKIVFNSYGDKVISCNMDGSIYMHKFDTYETTKTIPIFNLSKTKEQKFNDFDMLNNDSIIATTSLKPKHIWLYDTLIHQRGGLVMESQVGGNLMQPNRSRSQILVFNEKPGQLNVLDLKMNKLIANISLHNDEVTAATINENGSVFVVGFRDGLVKIYNADKDYELRESFMAFPASNNKKGSVSALRLHPSNGALFGSSQTGSLKVLRPKL